MSLDIPITFSISENKEMETSYTYYVDWDNGRIVGYCDKLEAVKQFIKKALITPRFKCLIYDSQYGSEIRESVIRNNATREYIETEMPFLVSDALIHDERIQKVYNITFEFLDSYPLADSVIIRCDVDTIFGTAGIGEVI